MKAVISGSQADIRKRPAMPETSPHDMAKSADSFRLTTRYKKKKRTQLPIARGEASPIRPLRFNASIA